jgi:hypothetical protein
MSDTFKGFALFSDIEDPALRSRNRGVVMANIAETYSKNQKITPNGAALIFGYFQAIKPEDRADTEVAFVKSMKERGFVITQT